MEGFWPIFFLAVVLKIPVFGALFLVWWAIRAEPEVEDAPEADDGGFKRHRPQPRQPSGPRRGPHAPDPLPLPACPPGGRFRVVRAPEPVTARRSHRGKRAPARNT